MKFGFSVRLFTGSFDKVVKVWTQDGQIMHKFDGFRQVAKLIYITIGLANLWFTGRNKTNPLPGPVF